jgi:D-alanyl-lipoteichoic acid acyltransferase DltB (MBOAT superfamily)
MTFNSFNYILIFLPLTVLGYYVLRRTSLANLFMLCASLFFYAVSAIWYLVPLLFTALIDYFIGQKIQDSNDPVYRKRLLIVSIVANIGLLSVFKYTGWLSTETSALLGFFGVTIGTISIALPPAISFYTFQSMSYTIDIYRKEFHPYRKVVDYLSFVSFFPHLVAGPIMRARDLLPQLAKRRPLPSHAEVNAAFFMILFGLFQKTVIADNVGSIVELITKMMGPNNTALPPGMGLLFMYGFAFQIYCDFAGYTNIARGSAKLFNVNLMRNFLTPYLATDPSDFWNRWHISLSTWIRDYIYIPLGGNRHGTQMTLRNLTITMVLVGLWHGAGILFIIWGIYHGLLLVIYRIAPIDKYLLRWFGKPVGKFFSIFVFFHLVCIGWIFFRATPAQFPLIWNSILALPGAVVSHVASYAAYFEKVPLISVDFIRLCVGTLRGWVSSNWSFMVYGWGIILFSSPAIITDVIAWRKGVEFPDLYERMPLLLQVVTILLLLYAIQFFGRSGSNEFIYFAF